MKDKWIEASHRAVLILALFGCAIVAPINAHAAGDLAIPSAQSQRQRSPTEAKELNLAQRQCRTISERVQCGQDCRQVPRASGDGQTRVFVTECTPRYCNRTRQVCN